MAEVVLLDTGHIFTEVVESREESAWHYGMCGVIYTTP